VQKRFSSVDTNCHRRWITAPVTLVRNTFVRKVQVVETTSLQPAQIPYFRNSTGQKQGRLHRLDSGTLVRSMCERRSRRSTGARGEARAEAVASQNGQSVGHRDLGDLPVAIFPWRSSVAIFPSPSQRREIPTPPGPFGGISLFSTVDPPKIMPPRVCSSSVGGGFPKTHFRDLEVQSFAHWQGRRRGVSCACC
jgi:hypothetical protein